MMASSSQNPEFPSGVGATPLPVGILGTGRLALALGELLRRNGVTVKAVAGRNPERSAEAATFMGAATWCGIDELSTRAPLILISVSDNAIPEMAERLAACPVLPQVVLHVSGATGLGVLQPLQQVGVATGVLHPLQVIPSAERGIETLAGATFTCAGDEQAVEQALLLARIVGGVPLRIDASQLARYHAASVMACNYQVVLMDAALGMFEEAGISREAALAAMRPIIRANTENLLNLGPELALTGPLRRGDTATLRRHLDALDTAPPESRRLYLAAAESALPLARRAGLPAAAADAVASLLKESRLK